MPRGPSRPGLTPPIRPVREPDADYVTELFTLAFRDDPTWSWAFSDAERRQEHHRLWWGLYMNSALPYGCLDDRGWWRRSTLDPARPARAEPARRSKGGAAASTARRAARRRRARVA
jgi:hypothetical protein